MQALGESRVQLLLDSLARSPPRDKESLEHDLAWASATAALFTKVTRDYSKHVGAADIQSVIESTVGQSVNSVFL